MSSTPSNLIEPIRRAVPIIGLALLCLADGTAQSPSFRMARADGPPFAAPTAPTAPAAMDNLGRGRALLAGGDAGAVAVLRLAAQQSLAALRAVQVEAATTDENIKNIHAVGLRRARDEAAQAHLWWGRAESRLGNRDRAITALARAVSLFESGEAGGDLRVGGDARLASGAALMSRASGEDEAFQELTALLRGGLPLVAPDDVLEVIAARLHGGSWKPRRFAAGVTASFSREAARPASREFLLTSGKLFPGEERAAGGSRVWRVPPPYAALPLEALPSALKMDRTVAGYERETSGENAGLWRQTVRVFYASPFLTRGERDDGPRAEALCAQLVQVAALMRAGAGVANRHAPDGVTTLWLCETPALWPAAEGDEGVEPESGATGHDKTGYGTPTRDAPPRHEASRNEASRNEASRGAWRAGAWLESAPADMLLFRMNRPRHEAEWLRQLMHEYAHIALPRFAGFGPPLEPFGNGAVGETLGMLWATSAGTPATPSASAALSYLHEHIARNAIPSLRLWNERGPASPLRRQSTPDALRYLQGLAVYIERVYGAAALSDAFAALAQEPAAAPLRADSLLAATTAALRDPFKSGENSRPLWLAGALETSPPPARTAAELAARTPLRLRAGQRAHGWLHVPATAGALRIEWEAVAPVAGAANANVQAPVGKGPRDGLRLEGDWKVSPSPGTPGRAGQGVRGALRIATGGRSGWHRFVFVAARELAISSARFERDAFHERSGE